MKIKEFVEIVNNLRGARIPIVAESVKSGKKLPLSWGFSNDGDGWNEFAFFVADGVPSCNFLDTDAAKMILDYAYTDPCNEHSLFSDETPFTEYELKITWPDSGDYTAGGVWCSARILNSKMSETEFGFGEVKKSLVLVVQSLPDIKKEEV